MNLIDAWKSAKEGSKIRASSGKNTLTIERGHGSMSSLAREVFDTFHMLQPAVAEEFILSDGWQIEKTRRTATGKVLSDGIAGTTTIEIEGELHPPVKSRIEISWEE